MGKIFRNIIGIILAFILIGDAAAQDPFASIKNRLEEDRLRIGGYLSTQFTANSVSGIDRRQDPFRYRLNTQLSLASYGIQTAISFQYANNNRVFRFDRPDLRLPSYAFVGVSPSYKWVTLHLGTRTMDFSKYTLSGHSFAGAGIELEPGNWRISGMYGRLRRATAEDFNSLQSLDPQYRRIGWGMKIGYEQDGEHLSAILFNAADDGQSISQSDLPDYFTPAENRIISITGIKNLGQILSLEVDYAFSAFAPDKDATEIEDIAGINLLDRIGGLFTPRVGASYQKALRTAVNFRTGFGQLSLGYERVDPEYRTMGALFFYNDYENITGGIKATWQKLILHTEIGYQHNNLSNKESNQANRIIGSMHAIYQYSDKTTWSGTFSNFQTTNKLRTSSLPFVTIDSIVLSLVNQNYQMSFLRRSGRQNERSFQMTFSYQRSQTIENDEIQSEQSNNNLMSNITYQHAFPKKGLSLHGSFLLNRTSGFINNVLTVAPNAGIAKKMYDGRLDLKASLALINLYLDNQSSNRILQPRFTISYNPGKKQTLRWSTNLLMSNDKMRNLRNFTEMTSTLDWRLRF